MMDEREVEEKDTSLLLNSIDKWRGGGRFVSEKGCSAAAASTALPVTTAALRHLAHLTG